MSVERAMAAIPDPVPDRNQARASRYIAPRPFTRWMLGETVARHRLGPRSARHRSKVRGCRFRWEATSSSRGYTHPRSNLGQRLYGIRYRHADVEVHAVLLQIAARHPELTLATVSPGVSSIGGKIHSPSHTPAWHARSLS